MQKAHEFFTDIALATDPFFASHRVLDPRVVPQPPPLFITRDYYELFILLDGTGVGEVLGSDGVSRLTHLAPGRIYLWRPQDRRRNTLASVDPIEFFQVGIRVAEWHAFTSFLAIPPALQTTVEAPTTTFDLPDSDVGPVFEALVRAAYRGPTLAALAQFLAQIIPRVFSLSASLQQAAPAWLLAAVEAMHEEENLRVGMPRFMELAHVSSRQLGRLVRQYFGTTPGAILAEARIRHAMLLLGSTTESMTSIAERCGYGTATYLSYRFRQAMGMSPRDFRQRALRSMHGLVSASR